MLSLVNRRSISARMLTMSLVALVAGSGLAGCYERVVGVKGPNADAYNVHEPNLRTRDEAIRQRAHTVPSQTVPNKTVKE